MRFFSLRWQLPKTILVSVSLVGCQAVPGEGPLTSEIMADAGRSGLELGRIDAATFDIVNVGARSARLVSEYVSTAFQRRFGIGGGVGAVTIGVGDQLKITIFEAGADGLFSTSESKQTVLDVVVQPNGTAVIPYVGSVRFAGRTLEQARQAILDSLVNKAVEPDVIVSSVDTASRKVTVSGAVGSSAQVPLGLVPEKITDVIAKAGGPTGPAYETSITLVRGRKTGSALLKTIIEHPSENIFVQPGDQVFVSSEPRTFTLLGSVKSSGRVEFGADDLNLLEAVAMGGGGNDVAIDAKGYFLFRYEEPEIVMNLLGAERFNALVAKGMAPDRMGKYPIVYRFDMSRPDSLLVGQTFPVKSRDVIYASRHLSVDLRKFLQLIGAPIGIASQGIGIADDISGLSN
ncbi:polysaccharide biosynthesis/export family protein [Rhizobium halophilum]|uniref:polysaccharide biosynthesis/export family protein n=1 Tax=Rhizobium halophilum TaxID=2846852 RepID=UPI001EFECFA5|nr:polysaccharide biosynthesis/export family protein [Rhizobium halophilum]MCF6369478.1 polysaccharide export protein [Rhizobium halophilum]